MINMTFYLDTLFSSTVPVGGTKTIMVNVSVNNQQAAYTYLGKGFPLLRLIKLSKGEDGSGTCYIEVPECKENYLLRHSGDNTLNITLRAVTMSMGGYYKLYPYCLGSRYYRPTVEEFCTDC